MPQTVVLPRQVALISGVVEAGAVLRFYRTNTSTPQAVYTDAALTNPVTSSTADAAGVFQKLYLNPSAGFDYRITLENAAGVLSYTEDDISRGLTSAELESLLTQALLAPIINPRTPAETTALVTPSNYAVPSHDQISVVHVIRYGLSTSATGAVNRAAFDGALAVASQLGGAIVMVPPGTFVVDGGITISSNRTFIQGAGQNATIISFNPASADVLFHFTRGAESMVQSGIRGFGFTSSNSVDKTAVKLDDIRDCIVEELGISQGAWAGSGSIGVHINGRDTSVFRKLHMLCARPILISANANSTIDADHFHFQDMEIGSTETLGKIIEVEDGVYPSNLTFDGYQAWVLGKWAFYYNDTSAATLDSFNWCFRGVRTEQASDATGHSFHIASTNNDIKAIVFDNCYFDSSRNGLYGRLLESVTLRDCFMPGTTGRTNFDITFGTRTQLELINTFVNVSSTITLTNAVQMWATGSNVAAEAIPKTVTYRFDEGALVSRKMQRVDGVLHFSYKGTIADDAIVSFPISQAAGCDVATYRVALGSATGPVLEHAFGAWRPGTVTLTGSTNTATTSSDGDLCVIDNTNVLAVQNRLGGTMDIVFSAESSD